MRNLYKNSQAIARHKCFCRISTTLTANRESTTLPPFSRYCTVLTRLAGPLTDYKSMWDANSNCRTSTSFHKPLQDDKYACRFYEPSLPSVKLTVHTKLLPAFTSFAINQLRLRDLYQQSQACVRCYLRLQYIYKTSQTFAMCKLHMQDIHQHQRSADVTGNLIARKYRRGVHIS